MPAIHMAKKNLTVAAVLSVVNTGLSGDDATAFEGYLSAELGALKALGAEDAFSAFRLTGKGDKAKGAYTGAKVEFKGGHNTATYVIHYASMVLHEAEKLGINPPTLDFSPLCENWLARRRKAAPAPVPVS